MKTCSKCGIPKELQEFYKHPKTADGYFPSCKSCKCSAAREREIELRKNPEWVEGEKARQREKYQRLGYYQKQKEWDADKPWKSTSVYKNLNRDLRIPEGHEAHHWNYNPEFLHDVFIVNYSKHKKAHLILCFDDEKLIFKTLSGKSLDTKEKHLHYLTENGIII